MVSLPPCSEQGAMSPATVGGKVKQRPGDSSQLMEVASLPTPLKGPHLETTGIWVGAALTTVHVLYPGIYQLLSHPPSCQSPMAPDEVGEDYQTYFIDEVDRLGGKWVCSASHCC